MRLLWPVRWSNTYCVSAWPWFSLYYYCLIVISQPSPPRFSHALPLSVCLFLTVTCTHSVSSYAGLVPLCLLVHSVSTLSIFIPLSVIPSFTFPSLDLLRHVGSFRCGNSRTLPWNIADTTLIKPWPTSCPNKASCSAGPPRDKMSSARC